MLARSHPGVLSKPAGFPGEGQADGGDLGAALPAADQTAIPARYQPSAETKWTFGSYLPYAGLSVAIVTSIFYIFPPGTPQPGDMIFVLAMVVTIVFANIRLANFKMLNVTLGTFLLWIIIVNSFWFCWIGDYTFLRKISFYIYNAAIMLFVISLGLYDYQRLCKIVYWSCIAAFGIELFYLGFIYKGAEMRSLGTFNNPNQMGYWGLLLLACLGVARRHERRDLVDAGALAAGCYIIAQTLSRAATAAGLLMALAVVCSGRWKRSAILAVVGLGLLGGSAELLRGGLIEQVSQAGVVQGLQSRIARLKKNPDDPLSLWKRGYGRLVEHPEYLALGAGEGAFERLTSLKDKEFHSSLGNILLSYGVVGLALLFAFFYVVFQNSPFVSLVYFSLIMLYGITHMGMRDTMLWVFFGLVFVQGVVENAEPESGVS